MKKIGRVKRPPRRLIYLAIGAAIGALATWVLGQYVVFDISLDALRLLAISVLTIAGVLIGLVATIGTSIVGVSTSQKQFYQGMLVGEWKWMRDWFVQHPLSPEKTEVEVDKILRLVYRHSGVAACSEEETKDKLVETLSPLVDKWCDTSLDTPDEPLIEPREIGEFVVHFEGMVAALALIAISKDKVEMGSLFGEVMWVMGLTILIALGVLVYTGVPSAAQRIADVGYLFALLLIMAGFGPVGILIGFTTRYLRIEAKVIKI